MPTESSLYKAPFFPGGASAIDAQIAERLLAVALSTGGDYADFFFEYRAGGGFAYDEGILKSASRGVDCEKGDRVRPVKKLSQTPPDFRADPISAEPRTFDAEIGDLIDRVHLTQSITKLKTIEDDDSVLEAYVFRP